MQANSLVLLLQILMVAVEEVAVLLVPQAGVRVALTLTPVALEALMGAVAVLAVLLLAMRCRVIALYRLQLAVTVLVVVVQFGLFGQAARA